MKLSKLLSAVALMASTVAAQAALVQFTFNAPVSDPFSFYIEAEDDSIVDISVISPGWATSSITYDPGLSFIDFLGGANGEAHLIEVDFSAGSKAKWGAFNTATGAALNVTVVPEPQAYALALAGLGVAAVAARRRRAA